MTTTKLASDIATGDTVLYPTWIDGRVTDVAHTVTGALEYPETRVLYFADGYAVCDRTVSLELA